MHPENARKQNQFQHILLKVKKNGFLLCTLAGVMVGGSLGYTLRPFKLSSEAVTLLSYPGEMYMRALKLMMLPFISVCITTGTATLDMRKNRIIAVRAITFFLGTTLLTTALGLFLTAWIRPGNLGQLKMKTSINNTAPKLSLFDNILDTGRNIISDNIVSSTFELTATKYVPNVNGTFDKVLGSRPGTNMLGVVMFFILFGSVLGGFGRRAKAAINFFTILCEAFLKILLGIVWFTPVAVGSIICGKVYTVPDIGQTINQLAWFIAVVFLGLVIHQLILLQILYFAFFRSNPFAYYAKLSPCILTGFAISSKAATMPIAFDILENKLRKSERIVRFVLPLGSLNLNGTGLFMASALTFLAQINGIHLQISDLISLLVVVTVMSTAIPAIPSASLVTIILLCGQVGVPGEDASLLFAIDWLLDRVRTTSNIVGDCYAVAILEKLSEKELNRSKMVSEVETSMLPHSRESVNEEPEGKKVEQV